MSCHRNYRVSLSHARDFIRELLNRTGLLVLSVHCFIWVCGFLLHINYPDNYKVHICSAWQKKHKKLRGRISVLSAVRRRLVYVIGTFLHMYLVLRVGVCVHVQHTVYPVLKFRLRVFSPLGYNKSLTSYRIFVCQKGWERLLQSRNVNLGMSRVRKNFNYNIMYISVGSVFLAIIIYFFSFRKEIQDVI